MKAVVTGAGGLLAGALLPALEEAGFEVVGLTRQELDVTDEGAVNAAIESEKPTTVVQCAAFTAVDDAEAEEEEAFRVNAEGARLVARACQRFGCSFVYPSTDYVFSGDASMPYRTADPLAPISAYGRSKAAGERAAREAERALIVRTSWLYGASGRNFVDIIAQLARERDRLEVVDDQVARPTWTGSLARTITRLLSAGAAGTFHATDGGEPVSRHGFARKILELRGSSTRLVPVSSEAFVRPASRPRYSVLDCSETEAALGEKMPDWEEALARYMLGGSV